MKRRATPAPDPSRNLHVEKGRAVMVSDIQPHALQMHEKCRGRGVVAIVDGGTRAIPCKCATKRFLKAHPEVIIDKSGAAWWPAKDPVVGCQQ